MAVTIVASIPAPFRRAAAGACATALLALVATAAGGPARLAPPAAGRHVPTPTNTTPRALSRMSPNTQAVQQYMQAFDRLDRPAVLSLLTEDVEWVVPGAYAVRGKPAFAQHIECEACAGGPGIVVTRMTEQDDVVVAEGRVSPTRTDGTTLHLVFCDVFELRGGRIRRLTSYLMPVGA